MFVRLLESFPQRNDHPPMVEPEAVSTVLAALHVGDVVPPAVSISDDDIDTIPEWTVRSRELDESGYLTLVLIDPHAPIAAMLWEPAADVARTIHASPRRTLATPHDQLRPGYGPRAMLCDLLQQARHQANVSGHSR